MNYIISCHFLWEEHRHVQRHAETRGQSSATKNITPLPIATFIKNVCTQINAYKNYEFLFIGKGGTDFTKGWLAQQSWLNTHKSLALWHLHRNKCHL
jgi:hypothetical protein